MERLGILGSVADVVSHRDHDRLAGVLRAIERLRRSGGRPIVLVVHRWGPVVGALAEACGNDAVDDLARAFTDGTAVPLISVSSDRELPGRVLAPIRSRLVHRLAEPAGAFSFGLPPRVGPIAGGNGMVDVESGLHGVVAFVDDHLLAQVAVTSVPARRPAPITVVGDRVDRSELDEPACVSGGWRVSIGLDEDCSTVAVDVSCRRPLLIVGHPGSGRTVTLATIADGLGRLGIADHSYLLLDDADRIEDSEIRSMLDSARRRSLPLVVSVTTASIRGFGSWAGPLLPDSTVVLLNPSRADGELVRARVPDLARRAPGRAVVFDRGRATVVQVAV